MGRSRSRVRLEVWVGLGLGLGLRSGLVAMRHSVCVHLKCALNTDNHKDEVHIHTIMARACWKIILR